MNASESRCPYRDLFDPSFVADPYPALAEARRDQPVTFLPDVNLWLVSRHSDIIKVLRSPDDFTNANAQQPLFPLAPEAVRYLKDHGFAPGPALTGSDGTLHKRLRTAVSKALAFTPPNLSKLADRIAPVAVDMVSHLPTSSRLDIVASLTSKFPARVIFRLIGFPECDHDRLLGWCMDRLRMFFGRSTAEEQLPIAAGLAAYWQYCVGFVTDRLERSADDIAGNLLAIHRADPAELSATEVAGILFGLVFAGQETTSNALAETIRRLLEERSRWERVRSDRRLIDRAFAETLRLAPPIAAWRRFAVREVELGGCRIPVGSHLLLHLGSAGHDADRYARSEEFDLDHDQAPSLAFGNGTHFCLGAPLAKLEARLLLSALFDAEPALALVQPQTFDYVANVSFRGPKAVWVTRT